MCNLSNDKVETIIDIIDDKISTLYAEMDEYYWRPEDESSRQTIKNEIKFLLEITADLSKFIEK